MALIEVIHYPDPGLRKKSISVEDIDETIHNLTRDMVETMYAHRGVGLAAPQIGVPRRVITLNAGEGLITLLNPEIVVAEGDVTMEEGCLCLPGMSIEVKRASNVRVQGIDPTGRERSYDAEGLLARVFQHEIDHLNGILIIDKLSKLKRDLITKRLRKQEMERHRGHE